jgi:hypothetical protein
VSQPPPNRPVQEAALTWSFSDEHGPPGINLGFWFNVDTPGWIVQAAWLQDRSDPFCHGAYLLDHLNNLLKVVAFLPHLLPGGEGGFSWQRRNIKPAWFVQPGFYYRFVVWRDYASYAYIPGYFATHSIDSGPVHIPMTGFEGGTHPGVFVYGPPFRNTVDNTDSYAYGVDFGFQPR